MVLALVRDMHSNKLEAQRKAAAESWAEENVGLHATLDDSVYSFLQNNPSGFFGYTDLISLIKNDDRIKYAKDRADSLRKLETTFLAAHPLRWEYDNIITHSEYVNGARSCEASAEVHWDSTEHSRFFSYTARWTDDRQSIVTTTEPIRF